MTLDITQDGDRGEQGVVGAWLEGAWHQDQVVTADGRWRPHKPQQLPLEGLDVGEEVEAGEGGGVVEVQQSEEEEPHRGNLR